MGSVTSASTAPTVDALDDARWAVSVWAGSLRVRKSGLGDPADARGAKVSVLRLDAPQAAEPLVSGSPPLCNQVAIGDRPVPPHAPLVELPADGFFDVKLFVYVA